MHEPLLDDDWGLEKNNQIDTRSLRTSIWVQNLFAICATALGFEDIESIVYTGAIGSIIGMVVYFKAGSIKDTRGRYLGISALVFSIFCLILINVFGWGPSDAQKPISRFLLAYTIILFVVSIQHIQLLAQPNHHKL